jgi:hypothetical protein
MSITNDAIVALIVAESYWKIPGDTMTVCALTLWNDYTVIGKAACLDPAEFNAETGRRLAREDAMRQIIPLVGYEMASRRAAAREPIDGLNGLA